MATAPRFEDVGNLIVAGGNRDWQQNLRRSQVLGSLSYFKDGWFGNHHFKVGGEIFRTTATEIWRSAYPGDVLHVLQNRTPIEVYLFETPSRSESGLWTYSAYANDSWRLNNRLTLNLGLRFDRYRVFLPEQTHPLGRFNPTLQTFAGRRQSDRLERRRTPDWAVHDLAGDGKTLAKVSYGQYWLTPGTDLGFNANPNSNQWWRRYTWSDLNGSGVWEPGEEGTARGQPRWRRDRIAGPRTRTADSSERLGAWIERELFANVGVRTGIVWRGERQHFCARTRTGRSTRSPCRARFPIPARMGESVRQTTGPRFGATTSGPELVGLAPVNIVRNVPDADTQYWTWEITATRRLSGRWSLVAGFAHTWSRDQAAGYFGQPVRQNTYPLTPNDLINAGEDGRYEFTDLDGQDSRHVRSPLGRPDHSAAASPVRSAVRAHVRAPMHLRHCADSRRADRHTAHGQRHDSRCARGKGIPARWPPPHGRVRRRLQPAQRQSGAEHHLVVRLVVPAAAQHRGAAHRAGRRQAGVVMRATGG